MDKKSIFSFFHKLQNIARAERGADGEAHNGGGRLAELELPDPERSGANAADAAEKKHQSQNQHTMLPHPAVFQETILLYRLYRTEALPSGTKFRSVFKDIERLLKVGDQIVGVFRADGDTDQTRRDAHGAADIVGDVGV